MLLGTILSPKDLSLTQAHFSWDISAQEVELYSDPSSKTWGASRGNVLSSKRVLLINTTKIPLVDGKLSLWEVGARSTVIHELIHVTDAKKGFWVRLKERLYNLFYKYENRPHEKRARSQANIWAESDNKSE